MGTPDLQGSAEKLTAKTRPAPRRTAPLWFVVGFAGGMAALFFLDSRRGAARKQMVLDQVVARTNDAVEIGGKRARSG